MKIKKLLTMLVATAVAISSASALSLELTVNQGFPIEYLKAPESENNTTSFEQMYYNNEEYKDIFVTSTGLEATCYLFKNIGIDTSFDFAYSNKIKLGGLAAGDVASTTANKQVTSWYLKIAPAFKFGKDRIAVVLTPGFVFSNWSRAITSTTSSTIGKVTTTEVISSKTSQSFPFGLGIGAKFTFAVTSNMKINAGCDLDFMLVADELKSVTSTTGIEPSTSSAAVDNKLMNVMPKIGFTYVF